MFDTMHSCEVPDLEAMQPGAELGAALASLDYDRVSPHDLVRVLRAQQRQVSHYQAASYWTMNRIVSAYENLESESLHDIFN